MSDRVQPRVNPDDILALIEDYYGRRQPPPSVREIADHLGVARGTAEWHIARMIKKGMLRRQPGMARGIAIVPEADRD